MVYIYEELTNGCTAMPSAAGYGASTWPVRQQRLRPAPARHRLHHGLPGEDAFKCVILLCSASSAWASSTRRAWESRVQLGRLPDYLPDHPDRHLPRRRGRRVGGEHGERVRRHRWGTGMSRAFQYERTQSRIGAPPWIKTLQFIENSPIFWSRGEHSLPHHPQRRGRCRAVVPGDRVLLGAAKAGQGAYMFNFNTEKHGLRGATTRSTGPSTSMSSSTTTCSEAAPEWMTREFRTSNREARCERVLQEEVGPRGLALGASLRGGPGGGKPSCQARLPVLLRSEPAHQE